MDREATGKKLKGVLCALLCLGSPLPARERARHFGPGVDAPVAAETSGDARTTLDLRANGAARRPATLGGERRLGPNVESWLGGAGPHGARALPPAAPPATNDESGRPVPVTISMPKMTWVDVPLGRNYVPFTRYNGATANPGETKPPPPGAPPPVDAPLHPEQALVGTAMTAGPSGDAGATPGAGSPTAPAGSGGAKATPNKNISYEPLDPDKYQFGKAPWTLDNAVGHLHDEGAAVSPTKAPVLGAPTTVPVPPPPPPPPPSPIPVTTTFGSVPQPTRLPTRTPSPTERPVIRLIAPGSVAFAGSGSHGDSSIRPYDIWADNCHTAANDFLRGNVSLNTQRGVVACGGNPESSPSHHTYNWEVRADGQTCFYNWGYSCCWSAGNVPPSLDSKGSFCARQFCGNQYNGTGPGTRPLTAGQWVEIPGALAGVRAGFGWAMNDGRTLPAPRNDLNRFNYCNATCQWRADYWADARYRNSSETEAAHAEKRLRFLNACQAQCRTYFNP